MTSIVRTPLEVIHSRQSPTKEMQRQINRWIDEVMASLPDPQKLSPVEGRAMIARYTAVLEGNFIYWMTSAYLSVRSSEAHQIIDDNLREEVRDNHPGMLRKFAMAAHAVPTDTDILAVHDNVQKVRIFIGQLSSESILPMMAFFEGFIQKFMPYLGELAIKQGSKELEYTDVHGVVDIGHTQELYRAFEAEIALTNGVADPDKLLDGIEVLRNVLEAIIYPRAAARVQAGR